MVGLVEAALLLVVVVRIILLQLLLLVGAEQTFHCQKFVLKCIHESKIHLSIWFVVLLVGMLVVLVLVDEKAAWVLSIVGGVWADLLVWMSGQVRRPAGRFDGLVWCVGASYE